MADDGFKLPGSSYSELVKIARAYAYTPDDAVPKDVADRAGMDPTQVSRNNGFFVSIGVLAGGKKKSLTPAGRELAKALDFEMPDQVESAWHTLVYDSEFLKKIVSAVRIRGGMDLSALRNHVAFTAGQQKTPRTLTGAGSVIDVLKAAGLLKEDGGKVFPTDKAGLPSAEPTGAPTISQAKQETLAGTTAIRTPTSPGGAVLSIQVRIDCRPEELEGLGPQLRALLRSLSDGVDTGGDVE